MPDAQQAFYCGLRCSCALTVSQYNLELYLIFSSGLSVDTVAMEKARGSKPDLIMNNA